MFKTCRSAERAANTGPSDQDNPLLAGYRRPPAPTLQPGEPLWTLRKGAERADAELRQHGKSYGVALQLIRDGELSYRRRGHASQFLVRRLSGVKKCCSLVFQSVSKSSRLPGISRCERPVDGPDRDRGCRSSHPFRGCARSQVLSAKSALIAHLSVGDGPEAWGWAAATDVLWGLSYFFWRRVQATPASA
jgi:hypothetical protein